MNIRIRVNSAIELKTLPERHKILAVRKKDEHLRKFVARVIKSFPGAQFVFDRMIFDALQRRENGHG